MMDGSVTFCYVLTWAVLSVALTRDITKETTNNTMKSTDHPAFRDSLEVAVRGLNISRSRVWFDCLGTA